MSWQETGGVEFPNHLVMSKKGAEVTLAALAAIARAFFDACSAASATRAASAMAMLAAATASAAESLRTGGEEFLFFKLYGNHEVSH